MQLTLYFVTLDENTPPKRAWFAVTAENSMTDTPTDKQTDYLTPLAHPRMGAETHLGGEIRSGFVLLLVANQSSLVQEALRN